MNQPSENRPKDSRQAPLRAATMVRGVVGGVLMGLANLVPGISGGTMLLASGIYPHFIGAVADVTTLRWRLRSFALLASVGIPALLAIALLAGGVKALVVDHRWIMYSLFVGLTLGGVPVVWRMIGRVTRGVWIGAAAGLVAMAALAMLQSGGGGATASRESVPMLVVAGIAAASAMILPGISGGYLFLVLGVYVPVLGGIDALTGAVRGGQWSEMVDPLLTVVLPVGVGAVVGVVAVSNVLKWLLARFRRPTLGVLVGLLFGAVVGLWPFQQTVEPKPGQVYRGRELTEAMIAEIPPEDWPAETFTPSAAQAAGAVGLIAAGFAVTSLVACFGRRREPGMSAES